MIEMSTSPIYAENAIAKIAITMPTTVPRSNAWALPRNGRRDTYVYVMVSAPRRPDLTAAATTVALILSVLPALALLGTVNLSFVIDNLGLDLFHGVPDDQFVAGREGDDRVGGG